MSGLMRASSVAGLPVVTLGGESDYEIKDVVLDRHRQRLIGFTLRNHGFLGGPVDPTLPWGAVHGIGPAAVIVDSGDAFADSAGLDLEPSDGSGDVIGGRALTEDGTDLGKIIDVVIAVGSPPRMVGIELAASEELHADGAHLFVPVSGSIAVSRDQALLPDDVRDHTAIDLDELTATLKDFNGTKGDH